MKDTGPNRSIHSRWSNIGMCWRWGRGRRGSRERWGAQGPAVQSHWRFLQKRWRGRLFLGTKWPSGKELAWKKGKRCPNVILCDISCVSCLCIWQTQLEPVTRKGRWWLACLTPHTGARQREAILGGRASEVVKNKNPQTGLQGSDSWNCVWEQMLSFLFKIFITLLCIYFAWLRRRHVGHCVRVEAGNFRGPFLSFHSAAQGLNSGLPANAYPLSHPAGHHFSLYERHL